jgi:flagellar biosynthesis protein FlhF
MKIVRFFGLDSESAIQQARDYLGEEAVIFSHREINEGVEVLATAATEPANQAMPHRQAANLDTDQQQPALRLYTYLVSLGLGEELSSELAYQSKSINFSTPQTAIRDANAELAIRLPTLQQPIIAAGKTIAILGAELAGKTSTLIKLARQTLDNQNISALNYMTQEKLSNAESMQLMQQLGHPNTSISTEIDAFDLARKRFDAKEPTLTLIDNAPLSQQDLRHPENLLTASMRSGVDNYLILPANLSSSALENLVSSMTAGMKIKGCIISMVDKASSLGPVLAIAIKHQLPIALWSDGDDLDSHLYEAHPRHLVEKAIAVQRTVAPQEFTYSEPQLSM